MTMTMSSRKLYGGSVRHRSKYEAFYYKSTSSFESKQTEEKRSKLNLQMFFYSINDYQQARTSRVIQTLKTRQRFDQG